MQNRKRERSIFIFVGALGMSLVGLWAIGCGGSGNSTPAFYSLSITRLMTLNTAMIQYESDSDDDLPLRGKWMDELVAYARDSTVFHSPNVGAAGYGYALSLAVAGHAVTEFVDPPSMIALFDSTDLSRNATDSVSTVPSPPRYGAKNTISYLDGHVQDQYTTTQSGQYALSQDRMKQLDLGLIMYANDFDESLPLANQWMDGIAPSVKSAIAFHSPAVEQLNESDYGYAMNSAIAGKSLTSFASPSTTYSLFDSTVLTRNATSPLTTLPQPPRYGKYNTIGLLDGHIQ
jgi:hypothetical protein